MKVKGLRWMVIGLIMLITIINYLDRGTLNYMWVANIDYHLVSEADASADKGNHYVYRFKKSARTGLNVSIRIPASRQTQPCSSSGAT